MEIAEFAPEKTVVLQRPQAEAEMQSGRDLIAKLVNQLNRLNQFQLRQLILCIFFIIGTTGLPKGVVRDNGGHAVALKYSMKAVYNTEPRCLLAGSDVEVADTLYVYAPLSWLYHLSLRG